MPPGPADYKRLHYFFWHQELSGCGTESFGLFCLLWLSPRWRHLLWKESAELWTKADQSKTQHTLYLLYIYAMINNCKCSCLYHAILLVISENTNSACEAGIVTRLKPHMNGHFAKAYSIMLSAVAQAPNQEGWPILGPSEAC